jgi:hypothetical protein
VVSQCVPAVNIHYFGLFNPVCSSPLPPLSHPYLTVFSTYCYFRNQCRCNVF